MGILDRLEDEYVAVSSRRATIRDLLELVVGSAAFVALAWILVRYLLGSRAASIVAAVLVVVFAITIVSQAYWGLTGRSDYRE